MTSHPFTSLTAEPTADLRSLGPTFTCVCGCRMFTIAAVFDEETRLPGFYLLDGMCVSCGALAVMPTPIDEENES